MTTGGRFFFCFLLSICAARPCIARVVINELYYDHPATDTGHEFIELINTDVAPADIAGATIEFHNGTGTTWTLVWRAPAATLIGADGLFVVGGNLVVPLPDAVTTYSLQNGPDAIRLVDAQGHVLDTVGYGGLDDPAFVETMGAAKIPAGKSIARALDGVDSDDNAIDFVEATPTPGRHNVARNDAALFLDDGVAVRGARSRPGNELIAVRVENRGLVPIAAGDVALELADSSAAVVEIVAAGSNSQEILPGRRERVIVSTALSRG
ncbi:MAG TPA: lamin tail domain-containing protein, partial [Candidatus Krumholzibacteria bacterium]|nr:lamin tail domain-containing protein [Candidatus Krumholzibacteria bacterium]